MIALQSFNVNRNAVVYQLGESVRKTSVTRDNREQVPRSLVAAADIHIQQPVMMMTMMMMMMMKE